jgi:hypothetical protein
VSLYGPVSSNGSQYYISLDGNSVFNASTFSECYRPQTLLYHATNLGEGQHKVNISFQADLPESTLAIDYANVYSSIKPELKSVFMRLSPR